MDHSASPSKSVKQTPPKRFSISSTEKNLLLTCQEGWLADLDSALSALKKNGGDINARNVFGLTSLHIATWRNNVPMVKRLLAAGADPEARDGESGWTSLHRALHFGHLAVASVLLGAGASLAMEDSKRRTPVDLISGLVHHVVGNGAESVATEVFSWGSGTNYQLGTGNAHIQKLPCEVDSLHGSSVRMVAASKFHSAAVSANGELYTWGFGRGGRLGHPEFDIHSGQAAVITPQLVICGLGSRRVKAVAAAKHHTIVATDSGEVFTWGSNREGQLGYASVDTQPTPRRVNSLRARIVAVAAANKHSAALTESGEVFTWGCNKEGQLGYGTSNSASNNNPRPVECLKGKVLKAVSAAKDHTIVLGADGEVFTWGHRFVNPRRVAISRDTKKAGNQQVRFHRTERLHVISIAAGVIHSSALTDDGALFYWVSSDPDLRCQQLYSLNGKNVTCISAGKYWSAAVTTTGDVYMWDGKKQKHETPNPTRLHGVKRATSVSIGETHLLITCTLYQPDCSLKPDETLQSLVSRKQEELDELDEDFMFNDVEESTGTQDSQNDHVHKKSIPSLKSLSERAAIEFLVEPRNAVQLLEIADTLEADDLRRHCEEVAILNLDYILTVVTPAIVGASLEVLAKLEKALDRRSSELWSYRRFPTPTATFPAVIHSEEEENDTCHYRLREKKENSVVGVCMERRSEIFLQSDHKADVDAAKQVRALRKKLQQIEILEAKQQQGGHLDGQQFAKLQSRPSIEAALVELGVHVKTETDFLPEPSNCKGDRKLEVSRKGRRKSKKKVNEEYLSVDSTTVLEGNSIIGFPDVKVTEASKEKNFVIVDSNNAAENIHGNKNFQVNSIKKKSRKGGLSLFLSGALDENPSTPQPPPPPPPPMISKSQGPAWGCPNKISSGVISLRDIQYEQSKPKNPFTAKPSNASLDSIQATRNKQIPLRLNLPGPASSPISVVSALVLGVPEGEKNTPPWSSPGNSPNLVRPSLRDIQFQQEKKYLSISNSSPKIRTSGFTISCNYSPSEPCGIKETVPNCWYKPEMETPSSIRSIQIEERAIKDLKRFYTNVKLVKSQP